MTNYWRPYATDGRLSVVGDLRWNRRVLAPQLGVRRGVSVWLPPGYDAREQQSRCYPVIYMFDGQNLFDTQRAFLHSEWCVDETMAQLSDEGLEAIVVGVDHGGARRVAEYTPFGHGLGERTLDFFEQSLLPRINADFRTRSERETTLIAGSSMGGLMSLYALMTRPHLFGGAGVFSPAFWPAQRAIYRVVERVAERGAPPVRIYIDNGTREPSAAPMVRLLQAAGYRDGESLLYVSERGGEHNEAAWARRFPGAMRFLLRGVPSG